VRVRPAGADAALLEVPAGTAAAWRDVLLGLVATGALREPRDVVPAEATVLVDGVDAAALRAALRDVEPPADAATHDGTVVEVPTVYDGADLDEVARLWDTDRAGVVARHTSAELHVAFCGFAPGFPYLLGLDADVPRRDSPRTSVPAGSVALAGRYCGIYPSASPGGWQLIGRTATRLFDVTADPPALLPPGTRVRFTEATDASGPENGQQPAPTAGALEVVRAGALTTVQDLGRVGSAHLGVPTAGALDGPSARLANRLVGNAEGAALLETTLDGVTLRPARPVTVAVTGATAGVSVDSQAVEWGVALEVPAGAAVEVGAAVTGVRSYVAVAGGIDVTPVLGSRATDTLAHLGPRRLRDGDRLPLGNPIGTPPGHVEFSVPRKVGPVVLRVRAGPRDDWFGDAGIVTLTGSVYTVSADSNRVGARLSGPPVAWAVQGEMASEGVVLGAVQVPPDGQPVVFLADHPTTGGYPVIAVVEPADLAALAQTRPGTEVRFSLLPNGFPEARNDEE
jgi:KipI family sensor histidine kinase inhibitor